MFINFPDGGAASCAPDPATKTGFAYGPPDDIPQIGTVDLGREHDVPADVFGRARRTARPHADGLP